MRIIVSGLALALISVAAPAASACRVGPIPILAPVWEQAPTPDQLRPGEVALEVAFPANARLIEPAKSDEIVVTTCNPDQQMLFQIVRVLSGDARGAEFVIVPGSFIMAVATNDPATGSPVVPAGPQHWFVVGRINTQVRYAVAFDDPATTRPGDKPPALLTLHAR